MRRTTLHYLVAVLILMALITGACTNEAKPEGTLTVAELLESPAYDKEVRIYGEVSALGELMCTCFFLSYGGESVDVWYDTMVENDGTTRPSISVEGIRNRDRIIVVGELKGDDGIHYRKNDFWVESITVP